MCTFNCYLIHDWVPSHWMLTVVFSMCKYMDLTGTICLGTCVGVNAECRYGGVFVHEAVCDPSIGAFVSIHRMDLQDECPCWLILQDWRALSVLLTLRGEDCNVKSFYAMLKWAPNTKIVEKKCCLVCVLWAKINMTTKNKQKSFHNDDIKGHVGTVCRFTTPAAPADLLWSCHDCDWFSGLANQRQRAQLHHLPGPGSSQLIKSKQLGLSWNWANITITLRAKVITRPLMSGYKIKEKISGAI